MRQRFEPGALDLPGPFDRIRTWLPHAYGTVRCGETNIFKANYRNPVYRRLCVYSPSGTVSLN